MRLTGFRLILLLCLFVSTTFYVAARYAPREQAPLPGAIASGAVFEAAAITGTAASETVPLPERSVVRAAALESVLQETAGEIEPGLVDAVGQAGPDMPLDGHLKAPEDVARLVESLDRNDVVAVTVNEQHGAARNDVGGEVLRARKQSRKADNARQRPRTAKAHVKRHHRALTKAHKRHRLVRKAKAGKLLGQKRVKRRRRMTNPAPAFARIPKRQLKPLAAAKRVPCTEFWCVR